MANSVLVTKLLLCKYLGKQLKYYNYVGHLYCCTLLYVSCTAVHYCRSVVLLYINVGQLYCCT
jgi:hypothetical protein